MPLRLLECEMAKRVHEETRQGLPPHFNPGSAILFILSRNVWLKIERDLIYLIIYVKTILGGVRRYTEDSHVTVIGTVT